MIRALHAPSILVREGAKVTYVLSPPTPCKLVRVFFPKGFVLGELMIENRSILREIEVRRNCEGFEWVKLEALGERLRPNERVRIEVANRSGKDVTDYASIHVDDDVPDVVDVG